MKKKAAPIASVETLKTSHNPPHPERIQKIRRWHIDEATGETQSVATLNISVTAAGQIRSTAVAIEREHALVILSELGHIKRLLRDFARASNTHNHNVIRLSA